MTGDNIAIDIQGKTLTLNLSQKNMQERLDRWAFSTPVIFNGRMERHARMCLTCKNIRGLP